MKMASKGGIVAVSLLWCVVAAVTPATVVGYPQEDRIDRLPGWEGPLPTDWYSGYLEYNLPAMGNQLVHTHYIYIESEATSASKKPSTSVHSRTSTTRRTQQNDEHVPVIFWVQR